MLLSFIQQALLDRLKVVHGEHSSAFTVSVSELQAYLASIGLEVADTEVVENVQDLYRLDAGLRVLNTQAVNGEWLIELRWVLSASQRTKLWRKEQISLGRKARTFYLTEDENQQVTRFIDELRSEKE